MATPTYDLLESVTLATSATSVTFSSIDGSYGDLILVISATRPSGWTRHEITFNNSTTDYFKIQMIGDGSSTLINTLSRPYLSLWESGNLTATPNTSIIQIMDYSATDKHKSVLMRGNNIDRAVTAVAARWGNTAAISLIKIEAPTFDAGSTFNLYGIAKTVV